MTNTKEIAKKEAQAEIEAEIASIAAADAEESLKENLKNSFPRTAPYSRNELIFAKNYIREIRKWATENLDVEVFE